MLQWIIILAWVWIVAKCWYIRQTCIHVTIICVRNGEWKNDYWKKLICLDIVGDNKQNIINNLSEVAFQNGKINDLEAYRNAVYKREEEFSTALGYLVAMPHGWSNGVNEPFVVFGRCKDEIVWDENEIKLIFMIGIPFQNRDKTHMKILANISRKLIDDSFRESLLSAQNQDEIFGTSIYLGPVK